MYIHMYIYIYTHVYIYIYGYGHSPHVCKKFCMSTHADLLWHLILVVSAEAVLWNTLLHMENGIRHQLDTERKIRST